MPFYYALKKESPAVRQRCARKLIQLRKQLKDDGLPRRTVSETLLLASWNIREFDSEKYGERCAECFYYIAEIISHFDLVAIQEVREDLAALDRLQEILGGWWKYIVTDVTEGSGGNGERMAFMYDSRKVTFGGLAGEIVLPGKKDKPVLQFARTPFICGFKAGWSKFNLCTVHIYYGDSTAENPRRLKEIQDLAYFLADRAKETPPAQPARPQGEVTAVRNRTPENLILLGDFNIFKPEDKTMKALLDAGFTIPDELRKLPGKNVKQDKHYDQIAFMARPGWFGTTGDAGVINYYNSVFTEAEEKDYGDLMGHAYRNSDNGKRYYNDWRTYQMSDHLVMWVELKIDYGVEYLEQLAKSTDPAAGDGPPADVPPKAKAKSKPKTKPRTKKKVKPK